MTLNDLYLVSQVVAVVALILTVLAKLGSRKVWDDFSVEGLSLDFVANVEGLLSSGEDSYSLDKLLSS